MARPWLDAEIGRWRTRPETDMREILKSDMQPGAGAIIEDEIFAREIEETERVIAEQRRIERQDVASERNGPSLLREQAAWRNDRNLRPLGFFEPNGVERSRAGERPAETRM